jgi:hypothetical protein
MPSKADKYEALYPQTGCSEAQKEERYDRLTFKAERQTGRRTVRNRGVVIPGGNAWIESLPASQEKR